MSEHHWFLTSGVVLAGVVILGVFVIGKRLEDRKSGFPAQDERTKQIAGKAATYALLIGGYFMLALTGMNLISLEFRDIPLLDTGYALIVSVLVQSLTTVALRWYFNRKGDF